LLKKLSEDPLLFNKKKIKKKTLLFVGYKIKKKKKKKNPKSGVYLLTKSKKDTNNGLDSRL